MSRKLRKWMICCITILILTTAPAIVASASALDSLLTQSQDLEEYLHQLTVTMTTLSMKQEYIQENIDEVSLKIADNEVLLSDTQAACEEQYALMKKRIKYLYESGNTNYLEAILSAQSISDILNKFEYIDNLVGYDREMLEKYKELVDAVENLNSQLLDKKTQLEDLKEQAIANLNEASAASSVGTAQVTEYGVDQEEAGQLVAEYMQEYSGEIREEIQQEIDRKEQEDPDYNWLEDENVLEEPTAQEPESSPEVTEPSGENNSDAQDAGSQESSSVVDDHHDTTDNADGSDSQDDVTTESAIASSSDSSQESTENPDSEEKTNPESTTEQTTTETTTPEETQKQTETTPVEITFATTTEAETTTQEPTTEEPAAEPENNEPEEEDNGYISDEGYSDAYLIACLVSGEVGYSSYETQWAVADLIMNLVESPAYPGTVYGVLHSAGVFDAVYWYYIPGTSVPSYLYYIQNGPMDSALSAAYEAMGNRGASHGYLSYCADWYYENNPDVFANTYGEIIGSEYFYNWNY